MRFAAKSTSVSRAVFGVVGIATLVLCISAAGPTSAQTSSSPSQSQRVAGSDRYGTAVAISQLQWKDGSANTVFLASGLSPADALALGASTLLQGPLLLTPPDSLPSSVAAEISRLKPCRIILAGGSAAVSEYVYQQAESLTSMQNC